MVRLEFFKVEKDELQEFIQIFLKGGKYVEKFQVDGEDREKIRVNNNRIYIGNNYSLRVNYDEARKEYWFSLEYMGADDRIKLSQLNQEQEKKEIFF